VGLFRGPDSPFTQEDPIGIAGGLNLYGYAGSDPINYSDPMGTCPWCVGLFVGAGVEAFSEWASGEKLSVKKIVAASLLGALTGGVSAAEDVEARMAFRLAGQSALSVADGYTQARLSGKSYSMQEAAKDAALGLAGAAVGEGVRVKNASALKRGLTDLEQELKNGPETLLSGRKATDVATEVKGKLRHITDLETGLVGTTAAGGSRVKKNGGN